MWRGQSRRSCSQDARAMVCQLSDEESRMRIVRTVKAYWRISTSISVLACLLAGAAEALATAKARVAEVEKRMMIASEDNVRE